MNSEQIGIWIDSREAFIITPKGDITHVESNVEEGNPHGGYGSSDKFLAQDAVADNKMQRRKNQQLKSYFDEVMQKASNASHILVFGPGEIPLLFSKEIENHPHLKNASTTTEKADSMTQNQLVAKVREHFE